MAGKLINYSYANAVHIVVHGILDENFHTYHEYHGKFTDTRIASHYIALCLVLHRIPTVSDMSPHLSHLGLNYFRLTLI